jgi:NTE family protein
MNDREEPMGRRHDQGPDPHPRPKGIAKPKSARGAATAAETKTINLALQGGGAHGAFAWGVLDRLMEDGRIDIEGISATSAGAMNATVLACGFAGGGREGAREALADFWRRIANAAAASPLQPSLLDRMTQNHGLDFSPAFQTFDLLVRVFSPYQFNPMNFNPLRHIVEQSVDFERLRKSSAIKLYLNATNVRTGKVRLFRNAEITPDAVMASACLPLMFQAVEIEGEAYWDGGYMGNPAIFPLIYECDSADVVVVHINPIARPEVPRTAAEILNRVDEISFNSSLMREMRAIAFVSRLIDEGKVKEGSIKRMLIHSIAAEDFMQKLGVNSKMNADWEFLTHLRDAGRARAAEWLASNFQHLAKQSSTDFELYL